MSDPLVATITLSEPLWFSERKLAVYGNTEQNNFYAPLPVFFEGFNSTPRAEIVSYDWDFGDGSDHFSGFNAMHVYETPGTYTATLTVTRQAAVGATPETATDTIEVVVRARDGVTYYVDSALGDDSNAGTSKGAGAWKTATKAFAGIAASKYGPGDQILFERGQTFDFENNGGNSVSVGHWVARYGYKFGATGTGDAPIIKATGTGGGSLFYWIGVGAAFITFEDLEFDCTPTAGSPTIFFYNLGGGFNFLFHRVYAHDFAQGWLYSCSLTGSGVMSGLYLVDCDAYNSVVTQVYCVASRVAITGSNFDLSNNHIAYCTNVMSGVFDNNTFSRPSMALRTLATIVIFSASSATRRRTVTRSATGFDKPPAMAKASSKCRSRLAVTSNAPGLLTKPST